MKIHIFIKKIRDGQGSEDHILFHNYIELQFLKFNL
jgi:hypothetical protein